MLRFKAGSKLGENFYARQDGTRSYFFTDGKVNGILCLLACIITIILVGGGGQLHIAQGGTVSRCTALST